MMGIISEKKLRGLHRASVSILHSRIKAMYSLWCVTEFASGPDLIKASGLNAGGGDNAVAVST